MQPRGFEPRVVPPYYLHSNQHWHSKNTPDGDRKSDTLNCTHSNYETQKSPILLFIVTTSPCRDWVICAPAAILRCSGHFSGPFSGIEPQFPVTRHSHGKPIPYRRKLIGQEITQFLPYGILVLICIQPTTASRSDSTNNKNSLSKKSGLFHVLASELPKLYI